MQEFSFINSIDPENLCFKQLRCKLPQLWKDPQTCTLWKDVRTIAEGSDQERDILAQLPLDQLLKVPEKDKSLLKIPQGCRFLRTTMKFRESFWTVHHWDKKGKPECGFPLHFSEISGKNTEFQGCFVVFLGACAWEDQKVLAVKAKKVFSFLQKSLDIYKDFKAELSQNYDIFGLRHKAVCKNPGFWDWKGGKFLESLALKMPTFRWCRTFSSFRGEFFRGNMTSNTKVQSLWLIGESFFLGGFQPTWKCPKKNGGTNVPKTGTSTPLDIDMCIEDVPNFNLKKLASFLRQEVRVAPPPEATRGWL